MNSPYFFSLRLRLGWRVETARTFRGLLGERGRTALGAPPLERERLGQFLQLVPLHLPELSFAASEIEYFKRQKEAYQALDDSWRGIEGKRAAELSSGGPYRGVMVEGYQLLDLVAAGQVIFHLAGYLSSGAAPPLSKDKLGWLFAALKAYPNQELSAGWSFSPRDPQASLSAEELARLVPGLSAL